MDPSKDKTYLFMKNLARKNYNLDSFERVSEGKFVENNEELKKVGEEIISNFSKDIKNKIHFFADICAAPGNYSQIVLDKFDIKTGIGISLPPDEGGVEFEIENTKFKKIYKNILEKKYRLEIPEKLDLGMASCVSYQNDAKLANKLNLQLIIKSIYLLLPNFKKGSSLIVNMSMKNIYVAFNLINIIGKYFNRVKLWKSSKIWGTKNTFYFFGYDFNGNENVVEELNNLLNTIENEKNDIYNKFIGNKDEYEKINKMMKTIYQTRIESWKNLIEQNTK
jgi:hypothetical protein